MKFRLTLILLILNTVVFFFLFREESPFLLDDRIGRDSAGVLPWSLSESEVIEVEGPSLNAPRRWVQRGGQWEMEEPIEWGANAFAMRRMFNGIDFLKTQVRFRVDGLAVHGQSVADFGLDRPTLRVKSWLRGEEAELLFGAPTEVSNQIYLLNAAKDEILVVDALVVEAFLSDLDTLRDKGLFPIPVFEVRALNIEFLDTAGRTRFTRREDQWFFESPILTKANEESMHQALGQLLDLPVEILGKDSPGSPGGATPAVVRIEVIGNRRNSTLVLRELQIGDALIPDLLEGRFEGRSTRFIVPRSEVDRWRGVPDDLRERRLFRLNADAVSKIELLPRNASEALRMLRLEDGRWRLFPADPGGQALSYGGDPESMREVIGNIEKMIVLEFVSDAPSEDMLESLGLGSPAMVLRVEDGESHELQIGLASEDGSGYHVRVSGHQGVYLVGAAAIENLALNPLAYRERKIPLFAPEQTFYSWSLEEWSESGGWMPIAGMGRVRVSPHMGEDDERPVDLVGLGSLLSSFEVGGFEEGTFSEAGVDREGIMLPWRYRLVGYGSADTGVPLFELFLTSRVSASRQFGGSAVSGWIVRMSQSFVDLFFRVLDQEALPEEYRAISNGSE